VAGPDTGPAPASLAERMAEAPTPADAEAVLAAAVEARRPEPTERDRSIAVAADALRSDVTSTSVARLADNFSLSERQLLRSFQNSVGYGPKTLARVFRFQRFRQLAATEPGSPLARLAALAGYSDQAHLTRECQRLGGAT